MHPIRWRRRAPRLLLIILSFLIATPFWAAEGSTIRGKVLDPLGGPIAGAAVTLHRGGSSVARAQSGTQGEFSFSSLAAGRYRVSVAAKGFAPQTSAAVYVERGAAARVELRLQVGPLRQQVVVSATGEATPQSQLGASATVLSRQELKELDKPDVLDALRVVPGVQVVQQGQRGGEASIFVRGGNADFNKVLMDGVPVNEIGGQFDFSSLATSGVDHVEVFREPDSILYGSDALGSVIRMTTQHGTTETPQLTYSADGGNFHTLRQEASLGGVLNRFDYYSDFMRFDTKNSLPNNSFHNATYTGNFGWQPGQRTKLRLTVHHDAEGLGLAGPLAFYDIPDDSFQRQQQTYLGFTAENQTTSRWLNTLRFTSTGLHYFDENPAPTGTPSNPFGFGFDYLGNPVRICGANGYCTSGEAILDYSGSYPEIYNSRTHIRTAQAQSEYVFSPRLALTGGFNYIHESGFTQSTGLSRSATTRDNYDEFAEMQASLGQRAFATAGLGFEENAVFGFAATPRASAAYYLRRPNGAAFWGREKLRASFSTGIKEPSILEQGSSLFSVLSSTAGGPALLRGYGVGPVGAERSRSFDLGIDQGFWHERAVAGITYFHAKYYDLIDFVPQSALPDLGIPPAVAAQVPVDAGGAYINSDSYRSQGVEMELQASLGRGFIAQGSYTFLDAVVTRSFASSALAPAINPAFPNVLIGAYAPLAGNRPFRRAPQSGNFALLYSKPRFGFSFNGYFVGPSDDSTYLSDAFFGNTMLLPNRNLLAGYQLVGFSGWYDFRRHVTFFTSVGNVLDEHYQAVFGYPALPLNFQAGVRFTLGGRR